MAESKFYKSKLPWIIMLVLIVSGLIISAYLTVLHIRVYTDSTYAENSSVCSISKGVNCEAVAENPYSVFMSVPVSLWGFLGYVFMLMGAVAGFRAEDKTKPAVYMAGFTGFAVLVSITLGYISFTKIASICIFCFTTYFINAVLLGLSFYVLLKNKTGSLIAEGMNLVKWFLTNLRYTIPFVLFGLTVSGALIWKYPKYWNIKVRIIPVSVKAKRGVDNHGHHWIGAGNPMFTLEEFSDYKCPFCARYHAKVRELVNKYPTVLRLVHRNFPLDHECNPLVTRTFHIGSCHRAKLALCAGKQGKFWEANDLLFANEHKRFSAYRIALKLGIDTGKMEDCMNDKDVEKYLQSDIKEGIKHRLSGTPAFFLNGKRARSLSAVAEALKASTELKSGKTSEGYHWKGSPNPKITIYEYTDYECPFCRKFYKTLKRMLELFPAQIRIVHIHYPLDDACNPALTKPFHKYACELSKFAICADRQNKFFKADDFLFNLKKETVSRDEFVKALGLNKAKFDKCMQSAETDEELKKNIKAGIKLKISATPTFIINGKSIKPVKLFETVKKLLKKQHP